MNMQDEEATPIENGAEVMLTPEQEKMKALRESMSKPKPPSTTRTIDYGTVKDKMQTLNLKRRKI